MEAIKDKAELLTKFIAKGKYFSKSHCPRPVYCYQLRMPWTRNVVHDGLSKSAASYTLFSSKFY